MKNIKDRKENYNDKNNNRKRSNERQKEKDRDLSITHPTSKNTINTDIQNNPYFKYYEEFIKLKEQEQEVKLKLPKLINKQVEENKESKESKDIQEKFQLRGLVHEKEDFRQPVLKFEEFIKKTSSKKGEYDSSKNETNTRGYNRRADNSDWNRNKYSKYNNKY